MARLSVVFALGAAVTGLAYAESPAGDRAGDPAAPSYRSLAAQVALAAGLAGDDISPATRLAGDPRLRRRPRIAAAVQITSVEPAIRVHYSPVLLAGRRDRDGDGLPDVASEVLAAAADALRFATRTGLGAPLDDGDGELDIYLVPLGGAASGFAALESPAPIGAGASGFAVLDVDARRSSRQVAALAARLVGRLVLAARAADAPIWWSEPSALWFERHVRPGVADDDEAVRARFSHPELGVASADPLLARGNVALLDALDDPHLELRALRASWKRLERGSQGTPPRAAIEAGLRSVTGLGLEDLTVRAAISWLAHGGEPNRRALDVERVPLIAVENPFPIAPGGLALVRVAIDPSEPDGTRLELEFTEPAWRAELLAHRREGGWDLTAVGARADDDPNREILVPWNDYDRAWLVVARPESSPAGDDTFRLSADGAGLGSLFALSSVGASLEPSGDVRISWVSAWENDLFGWTVERALSAEGPWQSLTPVAIPALGLPRTDTAYSTVDAARLLGQTVYYRVVGVTSAGLRVTGPAVVLRHFPAATGASGAPQATRGAR